MKKIGIIIAIGVVIVGIFLFTRGNDIKKNSKNIEMSKVENEKIEKMKDEIKIKELTNASLYYTMGEYEKAKEMFESIDSPIAHYMMGEMYYNGKGVEQDYAKAKEWYEKAAEKDNASAMNSLGVMYYQGNGVKQDYAKAKEWLKKGMDLGDETAKENYEAIK